VDEPIEGHEEQPAAESAESEERPTAELGEQGPRATPGAQAAPRLAALTPEPANRANGANRSKRRGRIALAVASVVLLAASLAAALYAGGDATGLLLAFMPANPTQPRPTATDLPATARATLTATPPQPRATATATVKSTPATVTEGSPTAWGTFPPYIGPISAGQGCPNGAAPRPVSWAVRDASDYGAPKASVVALTFDDGPTPYYSPAIISYLEKTHTPATFFVLGQYAKAYPWLIRREAADGFTIGIHTWSHPDMRLLTPAQRAWQLVATAQQLHADLGANTCLWLWRPPYGSYDSQIVAQAGTYGLTTIIWNDDPADWSQPGVMTIVNRVLSTVGPGSIILMHDGPAGRAQTLAALPYILAGLKARHLTPVSLPQLLFGAPAPAPTPSPTATANPSPSPTDSPTPSPTDVATPTVTPTPTDIPTPTPTPTV
jgi:peptidoglycan/xylan/chitin deacetylase (PgdA/CDA1 family)